MYRMMSFGGGVQSTAIAMLCLNRDPRLVEVMGALPDDFVFADVGSEPAAVMEHTGRIALMLRAAGFGFRVVSEGNLLLDAERCIRERRKLRPWMAPFFSQRLDPDKGVRVGMMTRECTGYYKIRPLYRQLCKGAGLFGARRKHVEGLWAEQWLGISTDEAQREKVSVERWYRFRHPLLEMGWSREDCVAYLRTCTYPDGSPMAIGKSACVFCPYGGVKGIRKALAEGGESADHVRRMDAVLQEAHRNPGGRVKHPLFLTTHCVRVSEIDASTPDGPTHDDFGAECAGVCGV
jgi:hypothetical protein